MYNGVDRSPIWRRTDSYVCLTLMVIALCAALGLPVAAAPAADTLSGAAQVLILNSYHPGLQFSDDEVSAIRNGLPATVEVSVEYMDMKRIQGERHLANLETLYAHKYRDAAFQLVFALDDDALRFLLRCGDRLFPGAPVVFCGINDWHEHMRRPHMTGVLETTDIAGSLKLACALFPRSREVIVITDRTTTGLANRQILERIERSGELPIRMRFLDTGKGLTLKELVAAVRQTSTPCIVYYADFFQDRLGAPLRIDNVAPLVSEVAQGPVFVHAGMYVRLGALGGVVSDGAVQGAEAAKLARLILQGESPAAIPLTRTDLNRPRMDYMQMQRWRVTESALRDAWPKGPMDIVNRPHEPWRQYMAWIILAGAFIALESALLIWIWRLLRLSRSMERRTADSEACFHALFDLAPGCLALTDTDGRCVLTNRQFRLRFGSLSGDEVGQTLSDLGLQPLRDDHVGLTLPHNNILTRTLPDGSVSYWRMAQSPVPYQGQEATLTVMTDITDVVSAEIDASHESHSLRALLQASPVPSLVIDEQERVIAVNRAAERLFGDDIRRYVNTRCGDIIACAHRHVDPKGCGHSPACSACQLNTAIHQAITSGVSAKRGDAEIHVDGPHGEEHIRYLQYDMEPVQLDNHPYVIVSLYDITAQRASEQALRASEEQYRELVEQVNVVILRLDTSGTVLFANDHALQLFGYTADELIGRPVVGTIVPERDTDGRDLRQLLDQVCHDPDAYAENENENRTRDGRPVWLHWNNRAICNSNGQVVGVLCVATDISERIRMEMRQTMTAIAAEVILSAGLAVEQDDLRMFWQTVLSGVADFLQSQIAFAALIDDTGFDADQSYVYLRSTREVHQPAPKALWSAVCLSGIAAISDPQDPLELTIHGVTHLIGQWAMVPVSDHTRIRLIIGAANRPAYHQDHLDQLALFAERVWGLIERREAAREHARLQEQLNQAQKMESIGRLAGGVAHDYNNMLGAILGYADMALRRVPDTDPLHNQLKQIWLAAQRSADLTRQLLAFARKQAVEPRVMDLGAAVDGMMQMLRRLIGEDITLTWNTAGELWPVRIDPSQLDQILANLCVNARDAIFGKGSITISAANVHLSDSAHTDIPLAGECVMLRVSDDGCGMDAQTTARIFEPYYTTKDLGHGTGLGLATVQSIVSQNGGTITVSSQPGVGSTFTVYLPRHTETPTDHVPQPPSEQLPEGHGESLLIVEDETPLREVTRYMLESLGYKVITAASPQEAIRLVDSAPSTVDLIITDVVMPEMSGNEMAEVLLQRRPDLRIIYMSGYTADIIARHGILPDGVHVIPKPYTQQELAQHVRQALDTKENEQ